METKTNVIVKNTNPINTKNLLKFILFSSFGVAMFLVPIPQEKSFTTLISQLKDVIEHFLSPVLSYLVWGVTACSVAVPILHKCLKPKWLEENQMLRKAFLTTPFYFVTRVFGLIVVTMVLFQFGLEAIISKNTGGTMISLAGTLFAIAWALSFVMPFLTDCGIMEFLGIITKKIVRPLFHVPGRASIDLVTSWFGASNAAVILTREQYMKGYYSKKEAGIIMTNFSLVSVPFCLLIAETIGITQYFPSFYLTICVVGILLAVIMCRIPPLCNLPSTYHEITGKKIDEDISENQSLFQTALEKSCTRAELFNTADVLKGGFQVVTGVLFDLIPIVIAWGTLGLILTEYTPVFNWISMPMGWYLNLLGVADAFKVAPATLVGFIDMFIPAILISGEIAIKTKFVVGVLSLVQIIYLTEVGAIIIKSEVPLNLKDLAILFLERTIIALPVIVLFANIFVK